MAKRLVVIFAILALAVAFCGTVPVPGGKFSITLTQPSVVKGVVLQPGDYKLKLAGDKVTIENEKQTVESTVKVDTAPKKFDSTSLRYMNEAGKQLLVEIHIGGTKTSVTFN
jgi:hypothetical protein